MKKQLIRTTALFLAVFIMLCPLCVCIATDPSPEPTITPTNPAVQQANELAKDLIYFYIWYYLQSVGITVEYGDIENYTGVINDWIETELLEWLDTVPSIRSIDSLIFPWKFFWNPDGYLVGNQSFLDDIREFTDFLIDIFDLEDNATQQVESLESELGEVVVYSLPFVCSDSASRPTQFTWTMYTSQDEGYFAFQGTGSTCFLRFMSKTQTQVIQTRQFNGNTYTSNTNLGEHHGDWYSNTSEVALNKVSYGLTGYQFYTQDTIISAMDNNNQVSYYGNNIYILTNTINPPSTDDANGSNSIVITPSGNIYTPLDWDGSVYVDNLPAIVNTGSIRKLDLVSVFAPIKAFANTFSDGFDLLVQIVYNMPTAIVSIALTIMSAIAVFGTIKIFKEH